MNTIENKLTKIDKGTIVTPLGFKVGGIHSGVKRSKKDLGLIYCEKPASVAAVYTLNVIQAAPLKITKESISTEGKIQAVIVNSGNANACTGEQGEKDALKMRDKTAEKLRIPPHYVAVASTGVIGEKMPMDKIITHIDKLSIGSSIENAEQFNQSILTTDLIEKTTCYEAMINGKKVRMAGAAKGSGMIKPNMATMLAFVTTDVNIESGVLELVLKEVTNETFNRITVDGDTSTNDTALVLASGLAGNEGLTPGHKDWGTFKSLLKQTCEDLAKAIARDGEGATKLIEVEVKGASNDQQANQVAKSVVGSSLVKTAVFGADPNWGRIIAAVGYSGMKINPHTIDMAIGPIQLLKNSQPLKFPEVEVTEYLNKEEIKIIIDLNLGNGMGKAWGCDLTYDYVRINAGYRT